MIRTPGWIATSAAPGGHPLATPESAGFVPDGPSFAPDAGTRRVRVEAELGPGGASWEISRLGDPLLEAEALRLYEADTAGVRPGELLFARALIGAEGIRAAAFEHPERARAFLEEEAEMAGGLADHWLDFLHAPPDQDGFPPVLLLRGDGVEVMDGLHRLAGHAAHGTGEVAVVVGVAPGCSLGEIPGLWLDAPDAPEREPGPGMPGP